MKELIHENKPFGVFSVLNLNRQESRDEISKFLEEYRFFILIFDVDNKDCYYDPKTVFESNYTKCDELETFKGGKKCSGESCCGIRRHSMIREKEEASDRRYRGIAIISNGIGTKNFKGNFHRSNSHVSNGVFSPKEFKKIFVEKKEIFDFFEGITVRYGEYQVKAMKKIQIRAEVQKNQMVVV